MYGAPHLLHIWSMAVMLQSPVLTPQLPRSNSSDDHRPPR